MCATETSSHLHELLEAREDDPRGKMLQCCFVHSADFHKVHKTGHQNHCNRQPSKASPSLQKVFGRAVTPRPPMRGLPQGTKESSLLSLSFTMFRLFGIAKITHRCFSLWGPAPARLKATSSHKLASDKTIKAH